MSEVYYAVAHRSQKEIDSFADRYQVFDQSLISTIFSKTLGLTAVKWRQSDSWGTSHVIFYVTTRERSDELVLRANLGISEPEWVMVAEQLITTRVSALGLATNTVLVADVSRQIVPFDFQIQEKLLGSDVENHFTGSEEEYHRLSYQLGEYVARYHAITLPGYGRFAVSALESEKLIGSREVFADYIWLNLLDDCEYLYQEKVITKAQVEAIGKVFDDHAELFKTAEQVLVHHDLADHNIMAENNCFASVFDWEAAVVADPVLDLASCPTWRTFYPRENDLLAGYQSVRALPSDYLDRKNIYLLRTMLWKMVFAARAKIMTPQRAERLQKILDIYHI